MKNLYYISIEGVIGVGKTSLALLLGERLKARVVLEKFEENPFLEDFYKDPKRYAFQTQIYFLLSRYRQQQELLQVDLFHKLLITDYMFVKDKLFANLNLSDKELTLYNTIVSLLEKNIPKPDLAIYLQSSTYRLMENIKKRKRYFEENITREYIESLNQVYNNFFFKYQDSPLLIINTTEIDFVRNFQELEDLIAQIRKPIKGTKFYNPKGL
ncbi:MAG: deoxynucleoside kinase [Fidelibacterota bacterium]